MDVSPVEVDEIVRAVLAARKYRAVCPDTVRRIAARELAARGSFKAALKETKSHLHQVYTAFERQVDYEAAHRRLATAYATGSASAVEAACRAALGRHSSTAERLPILDDFYAAIWAVAGAPHSLLDLGCGLNPLALPWMRLPPGAAKPIESGDVLTPPKMQKPVQEEEAAKRAKPAAKPGAKPKP